MSSRRPWARIVWCRALASASDTRPIDVRHLGRERVICCWQVGDVLVDPGPESGMKTLLQALDGVEPRALLLTHIHLDHAGASGALVREFPGLEVYVHDRGAPHLVDPSRLLESAGRLYGDDMERLWGEVVPVPEANVRTLEGGETVHGFRVAYTPGHASHHVCYLHEETGRAFVGDVAGVRIPGFEFTLAPTPPPDIDLELWHASLSTLAEWSPSSLGLTHFGEVTEVFQQLATMKDTLVRWSTLAVELSREEFIERIEDEVTRAVGEDAAASYVQAAPPDQLWQGLERYWRKRREREAAGA
jgi:glyoxylase-like metal-dependent hydrolase (beta-lactamase superfamily II)